MGQQDMYENLCRKCYIKIYKPGKKEISKIVMSEEKYQCNCCKRSDYVVDYLEDF